VEAALAGRRLRRCDRVGARPVLRGAPTVYNHGELVIGDDFWLSSTPVRSHLYVTGKMHIGARVRIGTGAAISCLGAVDIEDDVTIGDFAIILDSNFHLAEDINASAAARPIRIGRGARLGHRVVVLPGSTVGAGAVVKAGSVVSGDIAPNSVVRGNPARARLEFDDARATEEATPSDVPRLVMQVLGLPAVPEMHAGPAQISQWDSLGALRLILALEETFGIVLTEDQVKGARSIRELTGHVEAAQRRKASPPSASAV
jgi:acetyltransferase-like isoleucine patch superfamily enzyme